MKLKLFLYYKSSCFKTKSNKFILKIMNRSGSQPRLIQTYTPRIKDGRYSNDNSPMKNNYMTQKKGNQNQHQHHQNPQTPKKNKSRPMTAYNGQKNIKQEIVLTAADSPVKKFVDGGPVVKKFEERKQQTIDGRKLQYPHPSYKQAGYHNRNQQQYKNKNIEAQNRLRRVSSAQLSKSRHFVDRSSKSREHREKHEIDSQKVKIAMNYLLENNGSYLEETSRVCNQKARPKQQIFQIKLANTPSTYREHYPPKEAPYQFEIQPQNQKTALSLGPRKVCGNSTNKQFHNGKKGPRADLATWPEGFKLKGPMDGTTSYANQFPDYGDYEKMVPIATFNEHPRGFEHKTNSTYQTHFNGKTCPASDLAKWNNMHPYGNDFDPNRGTTYDENHNSKQILPIQQWPMYDPRLIVSKGKFSTQYRGQMNKFTEHQLNYENQCRCNRCGKKGRKRIYN